MIQHFRNRFIVFSTCALILVIIPIIGGLSAITYFQSRREVNSVLTILVNNEGQMPRGQVKNQPAIIPQPHFTRESLSQYRFFSATIPDGKGPIRIDNQHILSVSPAEIKCLAQRVQERQKGQGQVLYRQTVYAYKRKHVKGQTTIVFLDESLLMAKTWAIIYVGLLLGVISLVIYTTILILFSRRAIRPIIEAEHRQKEFITNAGHELKTPLTVIEANTEMQELTSGESELTTSTKQQVRRLTELINHLVSLARLQEQPTFTIEPVNVSQVTNKVADGMANVAKGDGHHFSKQVAPGLMINADENYFYELVSILLDNANKYCDPDGEVSVALRLSKRKKGVILTVTNSYAKGDQVDFNRFFERFYREDKARTVNKKAGFGIGLSMAQMIVRNFGGKISAHYADGKISFVAAFKAVNNKKK